MANKKKGQPIISDSSKCYGCLTCQLYCSLRFEKAINLSKAQVKIKRLVNKDTEFEISFTEECDNCGICARRCFYGALTQKKKEAA